MQHIKALLSDIAIGLKNLEAEHKRSDALHFRIFDYLRDDEVGLSRCLADLLNTKGLHGQDRLFLDAFLELLPEASRFNCKVKNVRLEQLTDKDRRIDIYIEFENGALIGIENKPWTFDQHRQLFDYATFLNARGKDWILVYLCNSEPSEESITTDEREQFEGTNNFKYVNFFDLADCLESTAEKVKAEHVKVFVAELVKFIRHKINMEVNTNTSEKINRVVTQSDDYLKSALALEQGMAYAKNALMLKLKKSIESLIPVDQDIRLANGYKELCGDSNEWWNLKATKSHTGFGFVLNTFEFGEVVLRFLFENKTYGKLYWSIPRYASGKDSDKSEGIRMFLEAQNLFDGQSVHTTAWAWAEKGLELPNDWHTNFEPWLAMNTDSALFAQKFISFAIRLKKILDANKSK